MATVVNTMRDVSLPPAEEAWTRTAHPVKAWRWSPGAHIGPADGPNLVNERAGRGFYVSIGGRVSTLEEGDWIVLEEGEECPYVWKEKDFLRAFQKDPDRALELQEDRRRQLGVRDLVAAIEKALESAQLAELDATVPDRPESTGRLRGIWPIVNALRAVDPEAYDRVMKKRRGRSMGAREFAYSFDPADGKRIEQREQ